MCYVLISPVLVYYYRTKTIRKLRKDAAARPDEIGLQELQELENELAPVLVIIFRHSLYPTKGF
jgi:hypothetical protein